jgi:hypothetical protein
MNGEGENDEEQLSYDLDGLGEDGYEGGETHCRKAGKNEADDIRENRLLLLHEPDGLSFGGFHT